MINVRKKKTNSLTAGRPPLALRKSTVTNSLGTAKDVRQASGRSSKATKKLINHFHRLQKSRAAACASENHELVVEIDRKIEELGGLEAYQDASLVGQKKDRGGDSSKKLVEWLRKRDLVGSSQSTCRLRVLEVGSLSSRNAISGMTGKGVGEVKRIDLNSQEPGIIQEIDFMDLLIPQTDSDKFDIISLSLVLNYVPNPAARGNMLRRTADFLRPSQTTVILRDDGTNNVDSSSSLPCLFLVLPLPCIANSRYMTQQHLLQLLQHLGYEEIEYHESTKLCYMLLSWNPRSDTTQASASFPKTQINPGKARNNFAIILEAR